MLQYSVHLKPYVKLHIRIGKELYSALKLISKGTWSIYIVYNDNDNDNDNSLLNINAVMK